MNNRDELEAALRANAAMEVPGPDPAFVDALEQRLRAAAGSSNVVPMARRARRFGATTLVMTLVLTGAAAAAGLVLTDPFGGEDAAPGAGATTSEATTTVEAATSTSPATTAVSVAPVEDSTTTTQKAASSGATTTEVHVPATITISCHATGSSTECTWGPLPAGTTKLLMLRGEPPFNHPGNVYTVNIGAGSWTDPSPVNGSTFTYLVHAFDASDTDLGHSNLVQVDCC